MTEQDPRNIMRNPEAEKAVVGVMLNMLSVGEPIPPEVVNLTKNDFSLRTAGTAFEILRTFHIDDRPINIEILEYEIGEHVKANPGSPWNDIARGEITGMLGEYAAKGDFLTASESAKIVTKTANSRRAYDAGQQIARHALSANGVDPLSAGLEIIEKAMEGQRTDELQFLTASMIAELRRSGELPESPVLVEGLIPAGATTALGGDTSAGKTFLGIDAGIGVATGTDVWGHRVIEPGPVLYFGKDMNPTMLQNRMLDLCDGREVIPPDNFHFSTGAFEDEINLAERGDILRIRRAIEKRGAVLTVIDDLSTYSPGVDLNVASEIGRVMSNLRSLSSQTGCAFLVLTLLNKGNASTIGQLIYRIGGSVYIPGKVDSAWILTRSGQGENAVRTLQSAKNRLVEEPMAVTFSIQDAPHGGTVLAFSRTESAPSDDEYVMLVVSALVEAIKSAGGQKLKRSEIVATAKNNGLTAGGRVIKKAWPLVEANANVSVDQSSPRTGYLYAFENFS